MGSDSLMHLVPEFLMHIRAPRFVNIAGCGFFICVYLNGCLIAVASGQGVFLYVVRIRCQRFSYICRSRETLGFIFLLVIFAQRAS